MLINFIFFLTFIACVPKNAATIAATDTKYTLAMSPSILLAWI